LGVLTAACVKDPAGLEGKTANDEPVYAIGKLLNPLIEYTLLPSVGRNLNRNTLCWPPVGAAEYVSSVKTILLFWSTVT
jgi:hypothetical protein